MMRVRVTIRCSLSGTGGCVRVDVDAKVQGGVWCRGGFAVVVETALIETSVLSVVASAEYVKTVGQRSIVAKVVVEAVVDLIG